MEFQRGNMVSLVYKNLKKGDYEVKPFQTFKNWRIASDNSETFAGVSTFYESYGIKVYRALYPENDKYFGGVANISSSIYERAFTTQSLDPKLLWYYLDHNYYDNFDRGNEPPKLIGSFTRAFLYESSSAIIIPQNVFGERVKPGSVRIDHYGSSSYFSYTLTDDKNGNLVDGDYDTSKFVTDDTCILNMGFNEQYRSYNFRNKQTTGPMDYSPVANQIEYIKPKQISFVPGIPTTTPVSSSGTAAQLNGGYFKVVSKENFKIQPSQNFAISFWINVPATQSNVDYTYNSIINKNTIKLVDYRNTQTRASVTEYQEQKTFQYPFDVKINNYTSPEPHKIVFSRSSGLQTLQLTSSSSLATGSWNHVLCQKSGSLYSIYINGVIDATSSINIPVNVNNDHEMYIGGEGTTRGILSASLDEMRIYKQALTPAQIIGISDNSYDLGYAYQTNIVGNVFYSDGIMVVSDPRPKYHNSLLGKTGNYDYNGRTDGFSANFKSTTTFYEHEIVCKIRKNEYNFTQNPTVIEGNVPTFDKIKDFATSSFFNPYITTIGLYNDRYELIAIAKMSSPLEKRDDVDMNIIIRFDV